MGNIVKRLKIFVASQDKPISKIESEIGVSNGTLSKPFNNGKGITTDTLEKFLEIYRNINPMWLLNGVGEMVLEQHEKISNGFSSRQKMYLKEIVENSVADAQKYYSQDLKDTKKLLELELEVERLQKALKKLKSSSN